MKFYCWYVKVFSPISVKQVDLYSPLLKLAIDEVGPGTATACHRNGHMRMFKSNESKNKISSNFHFQILNIKSFLEYILIFNLYEVWT